MGLFLLHQDYLVVHHFVTIKEDVFLLDKKLLAVVHLVLLVFDVKYRVRFENKNKKNSFKYHIFEKNLRFLQEQVVKKMTLV